MDRFDLRVDVPPVAFTDLDIPASGDSSETTANRVANARDLQQERFSTTSNGSLNADLDGELLEQFARPEGEARALLLRAADSFGLSARGYHRVLRVARTIADLEEVETLERHHVAEALSFRVGSRV
jgi:magnesium chelatase family protein